MSRECPPLREVPHGGAFFRRNCSEPAAQCDCLALSELRERDIDVADVDVDRRLAGFVSGITRHVAGRFAVPNEIESIRPDLIGLHTH